MILDLVRTAYALLVKVGTYLQSPLLLAVRLYWGWQFFGTGTAKFGDLPAFTQRFTEWGVPFPQINVLLAATTETVCGLLLCVGLASRLISIPLIFTMLVAYLTADSEALHSFFSDPDKFVSATPFQFMFAALLVLAFGPGKVSLDYLLAWKFGVPLEHISPAAARTTQHSVTSNADMSQVTLTRPTSYLLSVLGAPIGYVASYFFQPGILKMFVSLVDYVIKAREILAPTGGANGFGSGGLNSDLSKSALQTAWLGIVLGSVIAVILLIARSNRQRECLNSLRSQDDPES